MSFNGVTATGIVLSAQAIGEYDKRIVLLTKELGKITAFARGARRMNSPYMAGTRPFSFGEFSLYKGRDSYNINGIKIDNYFDELSKDFEITCLAMYFMELAAYYSRENVDGSDMIKLIYVTFKALLNDKLQNSLVRTIYELKTLVINGEYPECFECVKCKNKDNLFAFDDMRNGLVCKSCYLEDKSSKEKILDQSTIYTMQYIISADFGKLYSFVLKDSVLNELQELVSNYLANKVDIKLKTLDMLKQL